jgi:alkylation response protein AidB-like acyl-CoA dehydrogenase
MVRNPLRTREAWLTTCRTLNMPTDHATVSIKDVWVPETFALGPIHNGLGVAQAFVHENRIRQAASSLGAAVYCVQQSVEYANERAPFGTPLSHNQGIRFPLVELATQCEMLRQLIRKTALEMDSMPHTEIERKIGDKVSMCNYYANRLCTEAADRALSRSMVAMGTRDTTRSSIYGGTIGGIGLLKVVRRSRCAR